MPIDVFVRWNGQTADELEHGSRGRLHEAYWSDPSATAHLVFEAFTSKGGAQISAKALRERLGSTLDVVGEQLLYESDEDVADAKQQFIDFVELCEEKECETGEPCTIVASY